MHFTFSAEVWRWPARPAWHFVTVPFEVADEIEDASSERGGFDSVKVEVTLGRFTWSTSLFPSAEHESLILPPEPFAAFFDFIALGDTAVLTVRLIAR
ncbi:MAG: DUF1905 domain-containing protein [Ilumatobacteraceae bacterium]